MLHVPYYVSNKSFRLEFCEEKYVYLFLSAISCPFVSTLSQYLMGSTYTSFLMCIHGHKHSYIDTKDVISLDHDPEYFLDVIAQNKNKKLRRV